MVNTTEWIAELHKDAERENARTRERERENANAREVYFSH